MLLRGARTIDAYHGAGPPRTDGWFPTGDLGFLYDNELYLCGRIKDLIIHNGKNIYPQDLEEVVNQDSAVHPGRTVALGRRDPEHDSEQPLVLFEPERLLTVTEKRSTCGRLAQRLEALFDIPVDVVAVPRHVAQENVQRQDRARQQPRAGRSCPEAAHSCRRRQPRAHFVDGVQLSL